MNDYITTTKQSTTKPCAYFLGYTVCTEMRSMWNVYLGGLLFKTWQQCQDSHVIFIEYLYCILYLLDRTYSISQEICTRFCCAFLCCGYAIVHNEFTWIIIHIHRGCFAGTGAIVKLQQCQWSKPDGYGTISQCITTTKHSKAKTVCIFLGIYYRLDKQYIFKLMGHLRSRQNNSTVKCFLL